LLHHKLRDGFALEGCGAVRFDWCGGIVEGGEELKKDEFGFKKALF
jgi:hypothetical protein